MKAFAFKSLLITLPVLSGPWVTPAHAIVARPTSACGVGGPSRNVTSVENTAGRSPGSYAVLFERDRAGALESSETRGTLPPSLGTPVEVVRCLPTGRMVQLAVGRIEEVEAFHYVAKVTAPSKVATTDQSILTRTLATHRNLYWQPMEGDLIRVLQPEVVQTQRIWPRFEFMVSDLFETREGDDGQYLSLSSRGRELLVRSFEQMQTFDGRFLVETAAQTPDGDLEEAQRTAQIRAGLIANYLAQVFELEPERLVPRALEKIPSPVEFVKVSSRRNGETLVADTVTLRILNDNSPE